MTSRVTDAHALIIFWCGISRWRFALPCLSLPNLDRLDPQAETEMRAMQTVMDLGRSAREKRGISLKTPVKGITVVCKDEGILKALEKLQSYVKGELNAWEVGDRNHF